MYDLLKGKVNIADMQLLSEIGISEKILKCPLCNSVEFTSAKGKVCDTCNLPTLGEEVIGFKVLEK